MITEQARFIIMIVALCASAINYILWGIVYLGRHLNKHHADPKIKIHQVKTVKKYQVKIYDKNRNVIYHENYDSNKKAKLGARAHYIDLATNGKNPTSYEIVEFEVKE